MTQISIKFNFRARNDHLSFAPNVNVAPSWKRFFQRISAKPRTGHGAHNKTSLLRYLFPKANVSQQFGSHLFNFRYWFLPTLKRHAQARVHRFLVGRQGRRSDRLPRIVSNPQGRIPTFWKHHNLKDGPWLQRAKMAYTGSANGSYDELLSLRSEAREPGSRRKKFAGYLKAANEIRQSYFNQEGGANGAREGTDEAGVQGPGAFPDAAVVRSGNEEMLIFPSYARRHVKTKVAPPPPSSEESEEEYWHREWEKHQDDNAIVDADVRGWIYTPHRGPVSRKQRLVIGLARQLSGLPAPPAVATGESTLTSQGPSRAPSEQRSKQDDELIAHEAEKIVRKGEQEERYARRGAFSEVPYEDRDGDSVYKFSSKTSSRTSSPDRGRNRLSQLSLASSVDEESGRLTPPQEKRQNAKMTPAQLTAANNHLLNRLKPFMASPLENTPISAFFYNDVASRQHTVYTDASGHFSFRAALDFVPTHVRVLAGEKLSATEEVTVTSPKGVSMISDIDDTIKHSAIVAGAREIFRNAFIRELGDLTIDGVREWYNTMNDMGVRLHYVSNAPWQMYPVLTSYFKLANLPIGSFHMKQYAGMLQGIFEPVAERKKGSLEKILGDFPDRKFILVGDSGEADLEVYTDVALDHPGRVLGIFIRDVTSPVKTGYFDQSNGAAGGGWGQGRGHTRNKSTDTLGASKRLSRPGDVQEDDAELRAAIAASLADMEEETLRARKSINPDSPSPEGTPKLGPSVPSRRSNGRSYTESPVVASPDEDLIDFSDEATPSKPWAAPTPRRTISSQLAQANGGAQTKPSPSPPPKPQALRSPSSGSQKQLPSVEAQGKPPPPRPRKPSNAVVPSPQQIQTWNIKPAKSQAPVTPVQPQPHPLSQVTQQSPEAPRQKPPLPSRRTNDTTLRAGLANAHKALGPATYWQSDAAIGQPRLNSSLSYSETPRSISTRSANSTNDPPPASSSTKKAAPPPPPRLRNMASYSTTASNRKAADRLSGGWDDGSGGSLPGSPGEAGMTKKEFLWNQRWARAKSILDCQGVTLRSWRVGSDVADIAVKLAEQAIREIERDKDRERKS
ncbi:hypothetical protein LTR37_016564 [Vermiconidia calcicola]|uniref:Uncharacterized protein n=1 Tax=Vermiconidia calcicola TaxID=1690605 RepID=A0ACC3MNG8_9PEZI|nr:hypothetical protein LTR37_016564 [Vermiconidia calcicola]